MTEAILAPPLTLRPLTEAHVLALQTMYGAGEDYFLHATGFPLSPQQAALDLAGAAQDDARHLLGIYLQDSMIGVIDLRLAEPEPFDVRLGLILLDRAQRRQGLGSLALRILEAWLSRDTPTEAVVIAAPTQNSIAQAFFLANGYAFSGQSTRVLVGTSRVRLLEMRKSLT